MGAAVALRISERTVAKHLESIYRKLGVSTRSVAGAAAQAVYGTEVVGPLPDEGAS